MNARVQPPLKFSAKPRILVVTLRRLGDVLLTTPLIRSLKSAWPDAEIDVLVFAATAGIVEGNPDINRVIAVPAQLSAAATLALMGRLFKRYDLAISTQAGDRPTMFALMAGRRHAGVIDPDGPSLGRAIKSFAFHRSIAASPTVHRVEQMLQLADALGIPRVSEVVCPAPVPLPSDVGSEIAVVHAAPMFRYKAWTNEGWRALADGLKQRGLTVVAIGGPDPAEARYLDDVWQSAVPILRLSWPQNAALLTKARLFVGPDTSVTHFAAATGCPTVALFGPTDPRLWGPWPHGGLGEPWDASGTIQNRGNVWLVQNPLPCLPCQLEGCERHIGSASACLEELQADRVLTAADHALRMRR